MPAPKKKKTTSKAPLSGTDETVSKVEKNTIDQLIQQVLLRHKNDFVKDKKEKLKELGHLALMCEEYLSTFALIGYSLQDEKVVIFNTPTAKDEAALVDLLRATFIDIVNNRP